MQTVFIAISILGALYFLLAKRVFDWFSVAFFSACIYFMPGFFGYTSFRVLTRWIDTPINSETYMIMTAVLTAILVSATVVDRIPQKKEIPSEPEGNPYVLGVLLLFAIAGLIMMILTMGSVLFESDKTALLQKINRWYIFFETALILGSILAYEYRK